MLKDSTAVVDVSYRSYGFAGRKATLQVRENDTLLKTEEVTLPADGDVAEKTIDVQTKNEGARLFSFTPQRLDGDRIEQNNTLDALIQVKNDHPQILYIEGEPRNGNSSFLRRAVQDDPNIRLVTILRSSQNKFYRQGIDNEQTLSEGFPKKRDELFAYKGLIFGSIESTFFTQDQLNMVVDFVSNRGARLSDVGRPQFVLRRPLPEQSFPADILPVNMNADRHAFRSSINLKMLLSDSFRSTNRTR